MTFPPTLETDRLVLTPLAAAHSAGMFALWSHAEVCRYSGDAHDLAGRPITLPAACAADSDRIIDYFVRRAAAGSGFRWAIIERTSGEFVGAIGFNHLDPVAEIAYHLVPAAWGRGFMREALDAAIDWVAGRGASVVEAWIDPANARSVALVERRGFRATLERADRADRYVLDVG